MSFWLTIALQTAEPRPGDAPFDLARSPKPIPRTIVDRCADQRSSDEIIVCGKRRDVYRLPLPNERDPQARAPGEAPSGATALTPSGRCGIFAGERRCSKAEAAAYGYGNGRDPVTLLTHLARKVADPDAD
jgi:hypothetical protein